MRFNKIILTATLSLLALSFSSCNILASDHIHVYEEITTFPTCLHDGSIVKRCIYPGCTLAETVKKILPARGHNYTESFRSEPACIHNGFILYECSNAGCEEPEWAEPIFAIGHHDYTETSRTEPTCIIEGSIEYKCSNPNCEEPEKTETIPLISHNYEEVERVEPEGCRSGDGYIKYACSYCNISYYDTLYAPDHDAYMIQHNEPGCFSDAQDEFGCRNCNYTWYDNYYAPYYCHDFGPDGTEDCCRRCGEYNQDNAE